MATHEVAAARFLLTSGHLVATCLAAPQQARGGTSAVGALALALAGLALSLTTLALGLDVFSPRKSTVHVCCHFLGGVMVCRQLLYDLPPASLWSVVAVAHVAPTACSLWTVAELFVLRAGRRRY